MNKIIALVVSVFLLLLTHITAISMSTTHHYTGRCAAPLVAMVVMLLMMLAML